MCVVHPKQKQTAYVCTTSGMAPCWSASHKVRLRSKTAVPHPLLAQFVWQQKMDSVDSILCSAIAIASNCITCLWIFVLQLTKVVYFDVAQVHTHTHTHTNTRRTRIGRCGFCSYRHRLLTPFQRSIWIGWRLFMVEWYLYLIIFHMHLYKYIYIYMHRWNK